MVALKWSMQNLYGVNPGEVYWAASDVGWVVGHFYIVYAPLFHGCTSILCEGKPGGTGHNVHCADRFPRDQERGSRR
jgi:propionyl-CoA synthetase